MWFRAKPLHAECDIKHTSERLVLEGTFKAINPNPSFYWKNLQPETVRGFTHGHSIIQPWPKPELWSQWTCEKDWRWNQGWERAVRFSDMQNSHCRRCNLHLPTLCWGPKICGKQDRSSKGCYPDLEHLLEQNLLGGCLIFHLPNW